MRDVGNVRTSPHTSERTKAFASNALITSDGSLNLIALAVGGLRYHITDLIGPFLTCGASRLSGLGHAIPDTVFTAGESDFDDCAIGWAPPWANSLSMKTPCVRITSSAPGSRPRWRTLSCFIDTDEIGPSKMEKPPNAATTYADAQYGSLGKRHHNVDPDAAPPPGRGPLG